MKKIAKVKIHKNLRDKKFTAREIARELLSDQERLLKRDKKSKINHK
ncbi:MAG: hypothetical protein WD967_01840 [Candidatus Levyibacteriota bacterium]